MDRTTELVIPLLFGAGVSLFGLVMQIKEERYLNALFFLALMLGSLYAARAMSDVRCDKDDWY
jgi:hypothetical protein